MGRCNTYLVIAVALKIPYNQDMTSMTAIIGSDHHRARSGDSLHGNECEKATRTRKDLTDAPLPLSRCCSGFHDLGRPIAFCTNQGMTVLEILKTVPSTQTRLGRYRVAGFAVNWALNLCADICSRTAKS